MAALQLLTLVEEQPAKGISQGVSACPLLLHQAFVGSHNRVSSTAVLAAKMQTESPLAKAIWQVVNAWLLPLLRASAGTLNRASLTTALEA